MIRHLRRKSAPGVRDGVVRRKNNWQRTPDYDVTPQPFPFIDRQRAGAGYRHLLLKRDVRRFVSLLPDWPALAEGLNAIVLAPGCQRLLGYHRPGLVALCAWERRVERLWDADFPAAAGCAWRGSAPSGCRCRACCAARTPRARGPPPAPASFSCCTAGRASSTPSTPSPTPPTTSAAPSGPSPPACRACASASTCP